MYQSCKLENGDQYLAGALHSKIDGIIMATEPNPRPYKVRYGGGDTVQGKIDQVKGFKSAVERESWIIKQGKNIKVYKRFIQ
jgi:hypothetical protein